jgi:hypothetical protein
MFKMSHCVLQNNTCIYKTFPQEEKKYDGEKYIDCSNTHYDFQLTASILNKNNIS